MSLAALTVSAQDVIVKRNGDELQCKITEVNKTEVKYKRWSNQEGPTFSEKKSEIFMIKYENGEKDMIAHESPVLQTTEVTSNVSTFTPSKMTVADPTPISNVYLEYKCHGFKSGINKWGHLQSKEQSKTILTYDWSNYREAVKDEVIGKSLSTFGATVFGASIACTVIHVIRINDDIMRKGTSIGMAGGFSTGTALFVVGIIKAKRGHKNATQIVSKHNEEHEMSSKKTGMSKPEFNFGSNGNNLSFSLTF